MELKTKPVERQEFAVLSKLALAEDSGDNSRICKAELDVMDFYTRAGCPTPAVALLASLLINPAAIDEARKILPDDTAFHNRRDKKLYSAMLLHEQTGDLAEWWHNLSVNSGLPVSDVSAYIRYDFFNCAYVKLYAAQVLNEYAYNVSLDAARRVIQDFADGQTLVALDCAIESFEDVRAMINRAKRSMNETPRTPIRWFPSFGKGAQE